MKSILIAGTGAMATLFAALISAVGKPVTMLGTWPEAIAVLNRQGVSLVKQDEPSAQFSVYAIDQPSQCGQIDLALVLVKSWQTSRVARQLAACLPTGVPVVTLQNGLGNKEILESELGAQRVVLGVTTLGATLLAPGVVRWGGHGLVSIEEHCHSQDIQSYLSAADLQVEIVSDALSLAWGKLVINAAINPLTALLRIPNGALLEMPETRELMASLSHEASVVASACGIQLSYPDPVQAAVDVARRTAANRSSMLQDVLRGAPTEIDAICGQVVFAAQHRGIPVPVNKTMLQLVRAISSVPDRI